MQSVFDLTFYAKPDYQAYRALFESLAFSDPHQPLLQPSPLLVSFHPRLFLLRLDYTCILH